MAIWRTIAGAVILGAIGIPIGGGVIMPIVGTSATMGAAIGATVFGGIGGAIGRWRDKVAEAKEAHGETKAERKPESHRDRTIEEIRRKLEGFEEMHPDAQRELVLELCVTHSISPEIRESLMVKIKTAAYEAKAELIERVRDSLPERG